MSSAPHLRSGRRALPEFFGHVAQTVGSPQLRLGEGILNRHAGLVPSTGPRGGAAPRRSDATTKLHSVPLGNLPPGDCQARRPGIATGWDAGDAVPAGHWGDCGRTARSDPTVPSEAVGAKVRCGASTAVRAAKAEWPVSVQLRDVRRGARKRARCADSGHRSTANVGTPRVPGKGWPRRISKKSQCRRKKKKSWP